MNETLAHKIAMLPDSPGCYIMKQKGTIIYIGKAKNLKNRVKQYFHGSHTPKVAAMVSRVDDFDLMLCRTNFEALTLECNLIKKHRPFYNILLKDDKQYPYIKMDLRKPYPYLTLSHSMDAKDGAKYFGPYIGATAVRQTLDEVRRFFPLRTCRLALPMKKPHRPCVHHQIGRCLAPCAGLVTEADYQTQVDHVLSFLNGDIKPILKQLTQEMQQASERMEYERAGMIRDKIGDMKSLMERQHATQTKDIEQDVLAVAVDEVDAMVHLTHIESGKMEGGQNFLLPSCASEDIGEILAQFITQYYDEGQPIARHILAQELPEESEELQQWLREKKQSAVTLTAPKRGDKMALVQIAFKNAQDALSRHRQSVMVKEARTKKAMDELQIALSLPTRPLRIEGYDISNTQGILSVASMVVFENGMPNKKQYRTFRIKTVEGANDFASMAEVISRRFTHGLKERKERADQNLPLDGGSFSKLPDVVLIDGGPQQLLFAHRAMIDAGACVPMFGLAKREEEVFLPNKPDPIILPRRGNALHLIQHVRDEAHRFGITHHRALRGKASIQSELANIEGIGPKKQKALLKHFGGTKLIFEADEDTLCKVEGISHQMAKRILDYASKRK